MRAKRPGALHWDVVSAGSWQEAFVGVSAVLGESLDDSRSALCEEQRVKAAVLLRSLRSPSRQTRARAMAGALARVAAELDSLRLR